MPKTSANTRKQAKTLSPCSAELHTAIMADIERHLLAAVDWVSPTLEGLSASEIEVKLRSAFNVALERVGK